MTEHEILCRSTHSERFHRMYPSSSVTCTCGWTSQYFTDPDAAFWAFIAHRERFL